MSDESPVPSPTDSVLFGHFQVPRRADGGLWELGRGAMGVTYRAFDTSLRTEVALKVIRAEQVADDATRRRFQREARAAAKVRHPNVASVLYLGEQAGEFFYAMEFVAGRSLEALLKETAGPLPPAVAIALAAQAAAALNAAHRREVVHRDLKPANLMLLEGDALDHENERTEAACNRLLKIIDFGLARSFGTNRQEDSLVTQTFAGFIGTPAYASPEQASGEQNLDGRSDLYCLGVILWQMLTGRLPFSGRVVEVLGKHQFQQPPFDQLAAANVPAPAVELLRGLLLKDPALRQPPTAGELRAALDRLLRALVTGSPTDPVPISDTKEDIEKTSDTTTTPAVGTTLIARYRLGREVGIGDGGRLFLAADNSDHGRTVALKLLPPERLGTDPGFAPGLEAALQRLRQHPHPVLLAHRDGLQRSGGAVFYVREWAEGFSLDDLLRARGALRATEVFRLLDALPTALDHAAATVTPGAPAWLEVTLSKLFVTPVENDASTNADDWPGLRSRPVEDWPAFQLRLNPLGFPPPAASDTAEVTRVAVRSDAPVPALALLVRELFGASAEGFGPIAALKDEGNAILRRALAPAAGGGGQAAFADAADFWRALRATGGGRGGGISVPWPKPAIEETVKMDDRPRLRPTPQTPVAPLPPAGPSETPRAPNKALLTYGIVVLLLILGALGWWLEVARPRWEQAERQREETRRQAASAAETQVERERRLAAEQRLQELTEEGARRERQAAADRAAQEDRRRADEADQQRRERERLVADAEAKDKRERLARDAAEEQTRRESQAAAEMAAQRARKIAEDEARREQEKLVAETAARVKREPRKVSARSELSNIDKASKERRQQERSNLREKNELNKSAKSTTGSPRARSCSQ